jgi:S-adenosylmethionine-dependent methyltransferase
MPNATQFRDAEKYLSYLKTPLGRLRSDLTWKNLKGFLPDLAHPKRALDLGGGTGSMSVPLAKNGFSVALLDSSEEMLEIAQKEAEASGVATRISFHHADAAQVQELFAPETFDIVVCHNLLEYVADPGAIVRSIAHILREDAVASLLVRNRAGDVLKAAIQSFDFELVKENLSAKTVVESLYGRPVRVFDPAERLQILSQARLDSVAEYGVRVFADYRGSAETNAEMYGQLLALELILGAEPQFAVIARYTQTIARRSSAPLGKEK